MNIPRVLRRKPTKAVVTWREWIAIGSLIVTLVGAAISYGVMASELADAREEISLLRADMRAINQHFIAWVARHGAP